MEKVIVERWEMADSIRLEKLYHIREFKKIPFFVSDYFKVYHTL